MVLSLRGSIFLVAAALSVSGGTAYAGALSDQERLGKKLYFDTALSEPDGQSCSSCHTPSTGFAEPNRGKPVSEGVIDGLFGGRNSPTASYAMYVPDFHFDAAEGLWKGGLFWDGRATGDVLGDPLADQALAPFLNPVEMANTSPMTVVRDALQSNYQTLFINVCGNTDLNDSAQVESAYHCIASAIGAFERTKRFGKFTSKYDRYLKKCLKKAGTTPQAMQDCAQGNGESAQLAADQILSSAEWKGLQLFMGENNNDGVMDKGEGAMCSACHVADWTDEKDYTRNVQSPSWAPAGMIPPVFTDHTYDNLGVPKNPHPLTANNAPDAGLGERETGQALEGAFRVVGLRNVGDTRPYAHNGIFKRLRDIVHFYNSRDVDPAISTAEFPGTMNTSELGNLGLSDQQERQLVRFMKTLSDGTWND